MLNGQERRDDLRGLKPVRDVLQENESIPHNWI